MEVVERLADVLVVGSGGAGLRAALEAAKKGVRVLLVSKAPIGLANCTIVSGGAFSAAIEGLDPEAYFKLTIETGKYLNNKKLIEILAREAPSRILELEEMGLEMVKRKGSAIVKDSPGSSMIRGKKITRVLETESRKAGVAFDERVIVIDLFYKDNRVTGAIGYNYFTDQILIYQARAIVMATGGAGAVYARHDNPGHITGDGFATLYRAGVELQDMEMVQFYPVGLADPKHADFLIPPSVVDEGVLRNARNEDIKIKYDLRQKPIAILARDLLSRAIFQEIREGNGVGNALLLDLTKMPEAKWQADPLAATAKKTFVEKLGSYQHTLPVSPLCHHFMGGVVIDESCQTELKGLFAAGEVTGGVHGANRMGGNALADTLVFGARAGANAASFTIDVKPVPVEKKMIEKKVNFLRHYRQESNKERVFPESLKQTIQKTMWEKVGLIRCQEGLQEALGLFISLEKESLPKLASHTPRQLLEALETINMLEVAKLITLSALTRQESRGAHYRTDFAQQNDKEWLRNICLQKQGEETAVEIGETISLA